MGLYTKTLLEREANEERLEKEANRALGDKKYTRISNDSLEEVQSLLAYVLEKFNMKHETAHGCTNMNELLECVLESHKIMYEEFDILKDKKWKKSNSYILTFLENGTPILLIPTLFGYKYLTAGNNQPIRFSGKIKVKNEAYMIFRPLPKKVSSIPTFIKYIFATMPAVSIFAILLMSLIVSLCGLVVPMINKWVLSDFVGAIEEDRNYMMFFGFLFAFVGTGLVSSFVTAFKTRIHAGATVRTSSSVQQAVMSRIMLLPYSYFKKTSSGTLARYVKNSALLTQKVIGIILGTTVTFIFSFVYIPQLFQYGGKVAGIAIIFLILDFLVSFLVAVATARVDRHKLVSETEAENAQFSTLKGIQKIKIVGAERRFYAKWAKSYNSFLGYTFNPPLAVKLSTLFSAMITSISTVVVLAVAGSEGVQMDITDYIAFNSALIYITTAVNQLSTVCKDFIGLTPILKQLKPVFELDDDVSKELEYVRELNGNIKIEHVSFTYENSNRKILDDLSLTINRGEKIAIVGESGCGKSSFIKLLLGLITPDSGSISFDGHPMASLNLSSLRKRITSVCQFSKLFPGTIYSNLTILNHDLTEEDAWIACEKACIKDDIKALPLGLDSEISESISCGFSGGQRQRIMLARAFASKNNILILDEATSALDNQTQATVLKNVYDSKATVVMVAHRLSSVINCDRILLFEDGKISEQGSYEDLMKLDGKFANLMRKQQLKENA